MRTGGGQTARGGFSLIELIAVILLLGILGGMAGSLLGELVGVFYAATENAEVSQKTENALALMTLRLMTVNTITTAGTNQIVFADVQGNARSFALQEGNLVYIPDTDNGNAFTLLDNVTGLTFAYQRINGVGGGVTSNWTTADDISELVAIDIDVTVQKVEMGGGQTTFRTSVNPRNNTTLIAPGQ